MKNQILINDSLGYSLERITNKHSPISYLVELKNTLKIFFLRKGELTIELSDISYNIKEYDCFFVDKDTSFTIDATGSFECYYLLLDIGFFIDKLDFKLLIDSSRIFSGFNVLSLKPANQYLYSFLSDNCCLLKSLESKPNTNFNLIFAQNTIQQLLVLLLTHFKENDLQFHINTKDEYITQLLLIFNQSLAENLRVERNVKFYCDILQIDCNLLNKICLAEYGVSVKKYIDNKCLFQIKYMLEESSMSLFEISEFFNFSDFSNFLRFFKRLTNMTVSEYRNQLKKQYQLKKVTVYNNEENCN